MTCRYGGSMRNGHDAPSRTGCLTCRQLHASPEAPAAAHLGETHTASERLRGATHRASPLPPCAAVIIGGDELARGGVHVKDLVTGAQTWVCSAAAKDGGSGAAERYMGGVAGARVALAAAGFLPRPHDALLAGSSGA